MKSSYKYKLSISIYERPYKDVFKGNLISREAYDFDTPDDCFEAFLRKGEELEQLNWKMSSYDNGSYVFRKEDELLEYRALCLYKERIR